MKKGEARAILQVPQVVKLKMSPMIDSLLNSLKAQLELFESKTAQEKLKYGYSTLQIPLEQLIPLVSVDIDECFFLTKPDTGFSLLGLGSLLTFEAEGSHRFKKIKSDYSKILNKWININAKAKEEVTPVAFLTFAFDENDPMANDWDEFPNTVLIVPSILIKEINSCQTLLINIKLDQPSYDSTFKHLEKLLKHYLAKIEQDTAHSSSNDISLAEGSLLAEGSSLAEGSLLAEGSSPAKNSWLTLTQNAITQIQAGSFDKLVTSRHESLQTNELISVTELTRKLMKHYPGCTIFSYQLSGKQVIAASPERLLTMQHPDIQSDAIGGTILNDHSSYHTGLIKQLIVQTDAKSTESKKLLKEHAIIAQDIYQRLDPLCNTLTMPISPFLKKLHNMYHLETLIQGKLNNEYDLFDVIETLHPTPAVAGYPAQESKQWLLENEHYHRGWYTGAFGWLEGNQNGELSVMLRCALIKDNQLDIFAGAGLIAESDPESEWQETELKMQTIIEML